MKNIKYCIFTTILFSAITSFASHMTGGSITYKYLPGTHEYEFTYIESTESACVAVNQKNRTIYFSSECSNYQDFNCAELVVFIPQYSSEPTAYCGYDCTNFQQAPNGRLFKSSMYKGRIHENLLNSCNDDWRFFIQQSNRDNFQNYFLTSNGYKYSQFAIEAHLSEPGNSSASFNNNELVFAVCDGQTTEIDLSATDPDGDYLQYFMASPMSRFIDPNAGALWADPISCPSSVIQFYSQNSRPVEITNGLPHPDFPGQPKPNYYPNINWSSPFYGGLSLSQQGILTVTPNVGWNYNNMEAQLAIKILEYKNGQLVGASNKDFRIKIVNCNGNNNKPSISGYDNTSNNLLQICNNDEFFCKNIYGSDLDPGQNLTMTVNGLTAALPNVQINIMNNGTSNPILNFCWDPKDATTVNIGNVFSVTVTDDGDPICYNTTKEFMIDVGGHIVANSTHCEDDLPFSWIPPASSSPGAYYWINGFGAQVQLPNKTDFDPATYGPGVHTFQWCPDIVQLPGCTGCWDFEVTIESAPNVMFLSESQIACEQETTIHLSASPSGGTWSGGAYISNLGVFNPNLAGVNTGLGWPVTYSYTAPNGCSDSKTIYIPVFPQALPYSKPIEKLGIGDMINLLPGTSFELIDIWQVSPQYPIGPELAAIASWLSNPSNSCPLPKGMYTYLDFNDFLINLYNGTIVPASGSPSLSPVPLYFQMFQFAQNYKFRVTSNNEYGCEEIVDVTYWIIENQCSYQEPDLLVPDLSVSNYPYHGSGLQKYDFDFHELFPYSNSPAEPIVKWSLSIAPNASGSTTNTSGSIIGLGSGIPIRWGIMVPPQLTTLPTRGVTIDFMDPGLVSHPDYDGIGDIYFSTLNGLNGTYEVCYTESRSLYGYHWEIPAAYSTCETCTSVVISNITARRAKPGNQGVSNESRIIDNSFRIYPNPSNGIYLIEGLSNGSNVTVLDVQGRFVQVFTVNSAENGNPKIDISEKPEGMYLVKIELNNGEIITQRIVKK